MKTLKIPYELEDRQWFKYETMKRFIVWHGSYARTSQSNNSVYSGRATQLIDNWNHTGEKKAAPFIVDRDGSIYKAFDEHQWAYYLNIQGSKGFYDKQSINIELHNELGLIKENGLYYVHNIAHHQNEYRGKVFHKKYRGYDHYAQLDEPQVDSLINLTLEMCDSHKIEPRFYKGDDFNPKIWNNATILRHINCHNKVCDLPLDTWVYDKIEKAGIKLV